MPLSHKPCPIVIKGAGEMASGIAVRLHRAGFRDILMLEVPQPMAVRRFVCFSEAVYDDLQEVESVAAGLANGIGEIVALWENGRVAVAVDPEWRLISEIRPEIVIDATLAKRNLGTRMDEAPLVIALGPGFTAGVDAHCVVETQRGHNRGRLYRSGSAEPNTGIPGDIGGFTVERVFRAPADGTVEQCKEIGETVQAGDTLCVVSGQPVTAKIAGIVRGCIRPGIRVAAGVKLGDIDPRGKIEYCSTISEKARALGGTVLEAVCAHCHSTTGTTETKSRD